MTLLFRFRRLVVGSAGGQLILVGATPLLARVYSVEAFGIFALYMATINIFRKAANLRYERAIHLPRSSRRADALVYLCLGVSVAISSVILTTGLAFLFISKDIGNLWLPLLLSISALSIGVQNVQLNYLNRWDAQTLISKAKIVEAAGAVTFQLACYLWLPHSGLMWGFLLGSGASNLVMFASMDRSVLRPVGRRMITLAYGLAKRYRAFPLINTWAGVLNVLATRAPVVILSWFFGAQAAGYYGLCSRVLSGPAAVIGQAASMAFLRSASEATDGLIVRELVRKNFQYLFFLGLPVFSVIGLFGPAIFGKVFGEEWTVAGQYAQLLTPMIFLRFCVSPVSNLAIIFEKHWWLVGWTATRIFVATITMGAAYSLIGSDYSTVLAYSGGQVLMLTFMAHWAYRQGGEKMAIPRSDEI